MTRAAGYIRVSTEEQRKHGWNLGADRERIEATITAQGWTRHDIYDDGGRQGDDPNRPDFLRMLAEVDQFDVLIIRDLDRFSRKLAIYATAVDDLIAAEVTLYEFEGDGTGLRHLDLTDEDDRALADVKAVFAQLEKAKIKRRVRQAQAARARAGLPAGGRRPYGYRYVEGKLVVVEAEAQVVRRIFELVDGGTSQRRTANLLDAEGIRTSQGGRWVQPDIARVLSNPIYIGKIRRGKEWFEGQHQAIVPEALWQRVNAIRGKRDAGGRSLSSGHLLTRGMLRCGSCGGPMIPVRSYGGRPEVYKCWTRQHFGPHRCQQPSVRRQVIDETLLSQLVSRHFDLDGARDRLREHQAAELPVAEAVVAEAEREVVRAEARIARVTRGWQDDVISDQEYERQRNALDDELAGAQEAVSQARSRVEQIEAAGAATDAEQALLNHLAELQALVSGTVERAGDIEALRTVIRRLFSEVKLIEADPRFKFLDPAPYWLLPILRPEMMDWTAQIPTPSRVALPEPLSKGWQALRFTEAMFGPIPVASPVWGAR